MTLQDTINKINLSIEQGCEVKCFIKGRAPIIGKFLKLDDYEYLKEKGMVRMVNKARYEEYFGSEDIDYTRIFVMKSFYFIEKTNQYAKCI